VIRKQLFVDLMLLLLCVGLALSFRLFDLTSFITADEARSWYGRSIIFLDALSHGEWANTAPGSKVPYLENLSLSPAPGVTTMWAGSLGIWLIYLRQGMPLPLTEFLQTIPFDPLEPAMLVWLRLPSVLVSVIAVGITFWWGRTIIGQLGAVLAAGLIAVDPFYLALGRILGHDAMVATFMWLSLLAVMRYIWGLQKADSSSQALWEGLKNRESLHSYGFLVTSGVLAGMAVLSKYPALFMGAFVAFVLLMFYLTRTPFNLFGAMIHCLRDIVVWAVVMVITMLIIWPALWNDPLGIPFNIINDALRATGNAHAKGSFFLGEPVPDPGLLFYPLVMLFRLSPLVIVGLLFVPFIFWSKANSLPSLRWFVGLLVAYTLLYALLVTVGGKKQDRYLLPVFPVLSMLATVGYLQIYQHLHRFHRQRPTWLIGYVSLILLGALLQLRTVHPYYFTYYNPLFGGAPTAAQIMPIGWGEGLNEAADYLNRLPNIEQAQAVSWYSTTFEPYFKGQTLYKIESAKISRDPKPGLAADYLILYINQLQRRLPSDGALAYFQQTEPLHTVTLNGLEYAWVYSAPSVDNIINQQSRLVGQAELLGFTWLDEQSHSLTTIPSGTVPTLRLYWEWQGKTSAEVMGASVVDGAGHTVGWGNLITSTETMVLPQDGAIMTTDYAMPIFPGTQPGQYYLKVWLDRPATGERVGEFPILKGDGLVTIDRPLELAQLDDFELTNPVQAEFSSLTLLGFNLDDTLWLPDTTRTLELVWAKPANSQIDMVTEATLTLTPLTTTHAITTTFNLPFTYQPSQWQWGDHFRQLTDLTLPRHLPSGEYHLEITVHQQTHPIGHINIGGRSRLFKKPAIQNEITTQFDNNILLLGYDIASSNQEETSPEGGNLAQALLNGGGLEFTLYWQALNRPTHDYTVFVQLLDSANQVVAQQDQLPQSGNAPTTSWTIGEIIPDPYTLSVETTPGQSYRLIVGLYRPETGERLPLTVDNDTMDALTLITFQ